MSLSGRRVALYARFSSDRQNESSVDDQLERCRKWVNEHGGSTSSVLTFADRAVSAASLERPGWSALERRIAAGDVDAIVVESLDRVSRKMGDTMQLVERLRFASVTLHAISDGFDSTSRAAKMHAAIKGLQGDMFLDDLADKTRRGMEARALAGRVTGGLPYGFRSQPARDGAGLEAIVDDAQATVVRRIFSLYLDGRSPASIAAELNRDRIATPRASRRDRATEPAWMQTAIRAMLANETYSGRWTWNKREWLKVPGTNRRVCRERPRSQWVISERPELAIVDPETWRASQARTDAAARAAGVIPRSERKGSARRSYLLSGLLRCGRCRSLMTIHGAGHYYRCGRFAERGACPNATSLRESVAREAVLAQVRATLLDPSLLEDVRLAMREVLAEQRGAASYELPHKIAHLEKIETQIGRLVDALADGGGPAIRARLRQLEQEAVEARAAIAQLEANAADGDLPSLDELAAGASDLEENLTTPDVANARERLRAVLGDGEIIAKPRGGRYELAAAWLPGMLVAASKGRSEERIAGAGWTHATMRESGANPGMGLAFDVPIARRAA